ELTDNGIIIHSQVVLCPGINDGVELERTIGELHDLFPSVETLAVAPVGLTKYRDNLTDVPIYSAEEAGVVIDLVEKYQKKFKKAGGSRFVWPADEFYTIAERSFPPLSSYETIDQFENGVGMCRLLISDFNKRRKRLAKISPQIAKAGRIVALTGASAYPWLNSEIVPNARDAGIDIEFFETENRFWGDTITISGLLTGADLLEKARKSAENEDVIVLPPNCLNGDDLFLDNMTLADFKNKLGRKVVVGSYDMVETLIEAVEVSGNGI
ncbi:MAG: DUF512 domain-containing protein, partial [candidate division Zixibacteria bacterium]|nr:DUF512 domain-containing protein [candidate division Zixibacteria bacterium]